MKNKYSPFFAAYNASVKAGNPNTKEEVIQSFTEGRTKSLKDLDIRELQELIRSLQRITPSNWENDKADRMRKAIMAIFHSMGKPVETAIAWAEKQGVKGVKKPFNEYTTGELFVLIAVAEKIKSDFNKGIRKQVANALTEK